MKKFLLIFLSCLLIFSSSVVIAFADDSISSSDVITALTDRGYTFGNSTSDYSLKYLMYDSTNDVYYGMIATNHAGNSSSVGSAGITDSNGFTVTGGEYFGQSAIPIHFTSDTLTDSDVPITGSYIINTNANSYKWLVQPTYGDWCKRTNLTVFNSFNSSVKRSYRYINLTTYSISGVLAEIVNILPILLPILIIFLAIRKGYQYFKSQIRSA